MAELQLSNIISVSVSQTPQGIGEYNTSNLAIFSDEAFDEGTFGDDGYKIYLEPSEVGIDFGTDSTTYKMALSIFSQQPNILANNGYLVVFPMIMESQLIAFNGNPAAGAFEINYDGEVSDPIAWDDTASEVQAKLQEVPGLEKVVVTGVINSATGLTIKFYGADGNVPIVTITNNTLATGGSTPVSATPSQVLAGETYAAAITRVKDLVQFFGLLPSFLLDETAGLAAAAVVQSLNKIGGFASRLEADIDPTGYLDLLRSGNFYKCRGLYYGADNDLETLVMSAAYFGRALSTNFSGSNTTQTMQLKDLIGVQPDPSMTQNIYNKCFSAGADGYASFQGVPKVFSTGANRFFDQVYNLGWFVGAIEVAGFNYLAQASTKIPQTENGMDGLKGAYRDVCEQAKTNLYCAPGRWNSATTFGNQSDFFENINQRGYYIYSTPIVAQSQAAREDREAPLVSIALKEAGAIHSSTILIYVNA